MTSLPSSSSFPFGSVGSASVGDAIASFRRSQYLAAALHSGTESQPGSLEEDDVEQQDQDEDIVGPLHSSPSLLDDDRTPQPRNDFVSNFDWDDDVDVETPSATESRQQLPALLRTPGPHYSSRKTYKPSEETPLLRKVSFSNLPAPPNNRLSAHARPEFRRRLSSSASTASNKIFPAGQSTFGQTLFNSIAILLGIGMLSEPLAFSYAGWIGGTILIISYGAVSCYTAKILARIILSDSRVKSYSDISKKAFGERSTGVISFMFCLELFAVSVILVTLFADSLTTIFPESYSATTYKLCVFPFLIITVFLPLSLLSYTSILGIFSTVFLAFVICADGVTKKTTPGSLWESAPTSAGIENYQKLGAAFGLMMAGFSGHAVIPSLVRDMADSTQFEPMINWAFVIATGIYGLIGCAGYRMFGNDVSEEISIDLLRTLGYSPLLNQAALWMLVISPLSKFALATQPINVTVDTLLGIDYATVRKTGISLQDDESHTKTKYALAIGQRVLFTLLSVTTSIFLPQFSVVMSFLGAFSAFLLCIIGPICAKLALSEGKYGVLDVSLVIIGVVMATWGTAAAF